MGYQGQAPYGQAPYGPGGYPPGVPPKPPRHRGLLITLIALGVVLVLVVVGIIFVAQPKSTPAPTPTPTVTHSATLPPTTQSTTLPPTTQSTTLPPTTQSTTRPPTSTTSTSVESLFCTYYMYYSLEVLIGWSTAQTDIAKGDFAGAQTFTGYIVTTGQSMKTYAPSDLQSAADAALKAITRVDTTLQSGKAPTSADINAFTQTNAALDALTQPICGS